MCGPEMELSRLWTLYGTAAAMSLRGLPEYPDLAAQSALRVAMAALNSALNDLHRVGMIPNPVLIQVEVV